MNLPLLAIGFIHFNRVPQLIEVVQSVLDNVHYPRPLLRFVLSDDGSKAGAVDTLQATFPNLFDKVLVHQRVGMGSNWNAMIAACEGMAEFVMPLQDDWRFTSKIDLVKAVQFLRANPAYGFIRYHKLSGDVGQSMTVNQWDTRGWLKDYHHSQAEDLHYMCPFLDLIPNPQAPHVSPYSGGVHLRHKRFTRYYGGYVEGKAMTHTEGDFMSRVNRALHSDPAAPRFAMFPYFLEGRFVDIGTSYRFTEIEQETIR